MMTLARVSAQGRGGRALSHMAFGVQSPVSSASRCPQQVTTIHPHPHHPQPHGIPLDLIVTETKIATKIVTKTGLLAERTP